jgi:hypothetical protein
MLGIVARAFIACCIVSMAACSPVSPANQTAILPNAQIQRSLPSTTTGQQNLYVLNYSQAGDYVSVYARGTSHVLYEIKNGAQYADAMVIDHAGNVYLWSYNPSTSIIAIAAKTKKRLFTINGGKYSLGVPAVDHQGNLYVPIYKTGQIFVYGAGTRKISRKIDVALGQFPSMTFDSHDNLYVLTSDSTVVEFAAGTDKLIRTVGVETDSVEMAINASDDLYVLSYPRSSHSYSIEVFPPHRSKPQLTITEGLSNPHFMALDSKGDLFVLNANDITAYAPGATSPYLTFNRNNAYEGPMVIDGEDNLYVGGEMRGHFNLGYFKVFALGENKLVRTVSRDVSEPNTLAIGP